MAGKKENREQDVSNVIEAISGIIAHIGETDFSSRLTEAVRSVVSFDSSLCMGCVEDRAPQLLDETLGEGEREAFYGAYLGGAYLLAPGYRMAQNVETSDVCKLRDIFPGDMEDSQYFTLYWGQTGMIDEMFVFVRIDKSRSVYLAIGRYEGSDNFSDDEVARIKAAEPILRQVVMRHWRDRPFGTGDADQLDSIHASYHRLLVEFGADKLTPREYDVCQLMLRGHSSKSGARELGISPETERIHRGRVFQKLGVTSQVETLALFLQTLADEDVSAKMETS